MIGCVLCHALAICVLITPPGIAAPSSAPGQRLFFGVVPGNYYPGGDIARDEKFFRLLQEAGVTHIGYGFNWDNIEKVRGRCNWEPWDYTVDLAARFGITVQGCIVGCPEWALPTSGDLGWLPVALNMPREECIRDFERFVATLARRYAGKAELFEFWNEPNGYNMAPTVGETDPRYKDKIRRYTKYMKIAYKAFKKGNPRARMASGGMDAGGASGVWLEGLYANGAHGFMDAVAIHPYSNQPPYFDEAYVRKTRAIMDKHGDTDKPIWINEYGIYNPGNDFFPTVFKAIRRRYPYVTLLTYHAFKDFRGGDGLQPWGLADENLNIKPTGAYEAFKAYPKPPRKGLSSAPAGPCRITGKVADVQLRKPIPGAYVLAMPGVFYAKTDKKGAYAIAGLPEGTYRVRPFPPGLGRPEPVEVQVSGRAPGTADFSISRPVLPLGQGESFDPARDSADLQRLNLVVNGSFDQMQDTWMGQYGVGWRPFNTVQRMTYTSGAGVGGVGLSQKMGHDGAVQQGVYQAIPTVKGQEYRLTFWFAYTGDGPVVDLNNCNRFGIDLKGGGWEHPNPAGGRPKYGFPKTISWKLYELAALCDKRAGGPGKAEAKWYKFTYDFVAAGATTSIWFNAAVGQWNKGRRYFDEISVVPLGQ